MASRARQFCFTSLLVTLLALSAIPLSLLAAERKTSSPPVRMSMQNVHLHLAEGVLLDVRTLTGHMISRKPGSPPMLDDPRSYTLKLEEAEASMTAEISLA